jgi:acyl carrier protein
LGLDAINLILTIEDVFDVKITEDEAGLFPTVGGLHDLVWKKYIDTPTELSAKRRAYDLLCRELGSQSNIGQKLLTPDSQTSIIFPKKGRRNRWKRFSKNAGLKLPKLELSRTTAILMLSICILLGITVSACKIYTYRNSINMGIREIISVLFGFVFSVLIAMTSYLILLFVLLRTPLAGKIPEGCNTLDGLAQLILANNPKKFRPFTQDDIWIIIKGVLVENYGFKPEEIKPESRFIEDLGF